MVFGMYERLYLRHADKAVINNTIVKRILYVRTCYIKVNKCTYTLPLIPMCSKTKLNVIQKLKTKSL